MQLSGDKLRSIYSMSKAIDSMRQSGVADSVINITAAENTAAVTDLKNYTHRFITESKSPALSMFVLGSYQSIASNPNFGVAGFNNEEVTAIVSNVSGKFPEHKGITSIKNGLIAQQQQQAAKPSTWVNKAAPDFSLPDVNGQPVSLSSFKGKYVLVDFWASWCGPCRGENPNVVQAYQKFKDKNFTVLGVSLDRPGQKAEWVNAINEDKLTWTHVSDLKHWESSVVSLYGIEGIPFNVLVNPQGVVIAEGLTGQALEQKLSEVLK